MWYRSDGGLLLRQGDWPGASAASTDTKWAQEAQDIVTMKGFGRSRFGILEGIRLTCSLLQIFPRKVLGRQELQD